MTEVESVLSSDVEARVDAVTQSDVLADDIQQRIDARIARIEQAIEMVSAELANTRRSSCTISRPGTNSAAYEVYVLTSMFDDVIVGSAIARSPGAASQPRPRATSSHQSFAQQ